MLENIIVKESPGRWKRATREWLAGVSLPPTKISVSRLNRIYYVVLCNDYPLESNLNRIPYYFGII